MGGVDDGTTSPLVSPDAPPRYEDQLPPPPPFVPEVDEETVKLLAEFGLTSYEEIRLVLLRFRAHKRIQDAQLAEGCVVPLSEKRRTIMEKLAIVLARKHAASIEYSPELMLGVLLVIQGAEDTGRISLAAIQEKQIRSGAA